MEDTRSEARGRRRGVVGKALWGRLSARRGAAWWRRGVGGGGRPDGDAGGGRARAGGGGRRRRRRVRRRARSGGRVFLLVRGRGVLLRLRLRLRGVARRSSFLARTRPVREGGVASEDGAAIASNRSSDGRARGEARAEGGDGFVRGEASEEAGRRRRGERRGSIRRRRVVSDRCVLDARRARRARRSSLIARSSPRSLITVSTRPGRTLFAAFFFFYRLRLRVSYLSKVMPSASSRMEE